MGQSERRVFDRLSAPQINALSNVAFGGRGVGCGRATLESLAWRDLIVRVRMVDDDGMRMEWDEWDMPLAVHIAFCQWCAEREEG